MATQVIDSFYQDNCGSVKIAIERVNRAPLAVCQNVSVLAGADCTASASIDNGSSDPDGDMITITQSPQGPYSLGTTTVTMTVTDSKGASNSCSATVTVIDNTPPVVSCPAGSTATADANCQATIPNVLGGVTASDNCIATGSLAKTQSPPAGTPVGSGTHTITVTVTDAANNSSACTTTFTVVDATPPALTLNGANPMTVECHSGFTDPGATANDTCAGNLTSAITVSGTVNANAVGSYTLTYTVSDVANTASATRTVNVVDTTPPSITACATNQILPANSNFQAALPNLTGEVSAFDNCTAAAALVLTQSPPAGTLVGLGPTTVTLTVRDATGNSSACAATVTVTAPPAAVDFFLRGAGSNSNPPTLFLDLTAPPTPTAKFKDSPSLNLNGGNPWKEVGSWMAAPALTAGTLNSLSDLRLWLGLKNSDDQGTYFDLRVEVSRNGALVATDETYCIQGVTRNPDLAKEAIVSFAPFSPVTFNGATDVLAVKVLTRIGSDGAGGSCGGHSNAVGLRVYFDSVSRPSRFNATVAH